MPLEITDQHGVQHSLSLIIPQILRPALRRVCIQKYDKPRGAVDPNMETNCRGSHEAVLAGSVSRTDSRHCFALDRVPPRHYKTPNQTDMSPFKCAVADPQLKSPDTRHAARKCSQVLAGERVALRSARPHAPAAPSGAVSADEIRLLRKCLTNTEKEATEFSCPVAFSRQFPGLFAIVRGLRLLCVLFRC